MDTSRRYRAQVMLTTYRPSQTYGAFCPSQAFTGYGFSEALIPAIQAGTAVTAAGISAIASGVQAKKAREHELEMQKGSSRLTAKEAALAAEQAKVEAAKAAAEEAKASASRAFAMWMGGGLIMLGLAGIGAYVYVNKAEE